jgi:hypothetical protein
MIRAGMALSLPGIQRKGSQDENQGTGWMDRYVEWVKKHAAGK